MYYINYTNTNKYNSANSLKVARGDKNEKLVKKIKWAPQKVGKKQTKQKWEKRRNKTKQPTNKRPRNTNYFRWVPVTQVSKNSSLSQADPPRRRWHAV